MDRRVTTSRRSGFTLLELILVMVIACTALALTAPSLRGWSRGAKLRAAADDLVALARRARTQAAGDGAVYRLNIDPNAGAYRLTVQSGTEFAAIGSSYGRRFEIPEGFRIEMTKAVATSGATIDFFPNGRTEAARITLSTDQGDSIIVECPSPAERFRVLSPGEGS